MVQTYRALVQSLGVDYRAYTEEKKQKKKMKSLAEFVVIDTYDYDTYIKVVSSL